MKRAALYMVLMTLIGCATNPLGMNCGLFTGKPCTRPCWNSLTPGASTANDVDQFTNSLSTKAWPARDTLVYPTGCKQISIADRPGETVNALVNMHVENGKLTYIQSVHDNMPSLQQILDHLGPPEYFEALDVVGPDGKAYMLTIFYPKQGVVFEVSVDLKDLGFIKPDMVVSGIEYFEPGILLSYFLARYSCSVGQVGATSTAQIEIANIQPWSGFGEVKVVQTR